MPPGPDDNWTETFCISASVSASADNGPNHTNLLILSAISPRWTDNLAPYIARDKWSGAFVFSTVFSSAALSSQVRFRLLSRALYITRPCSCKLRGLVPLLRIGIGGDEEEVGKKSEYDLISWCFLRMAFKGEREPPPSSNPSCYWDPYREKLGKGSRSLIGFQAPK